MLDSCQGWDGGNYNENPKHCATHLMMIWVQYFYTRQWWDEYIDTPEAYTKWRETLGAYYIDIQDARDLYYRIRAFGGGWVGDTPGFGDDLSKALGSIKAKTLFIYNPQDQFLQASHIEAQVKMIPNARAVAIDSSAGHFIFGNADPQATRAMEHAIRDFLRDLDAQRTAGK
jgi:homoserine O-acetyltransferase